MDAEIQTRQILIEDMIVAAVTAIEALQINQKKISGLQWDSIEPKQDSQSILNYVRYLSY